MPVFCKFEFNVDARGPNELQDRIGSPWNILPLNQQEAAFVFILHDLTMD
jgi:hypothetical protein